MTHKGIENIAAEMGQVFADKQNRLTFDAYFELVEASPHLHLRNSAQYLRDCFLYFGQHEDGAFKLFDLPFSEEADRLIGQQSAQKRIFDLIDGFVKGATVNKLVLLHGPNGSAKSTFVDTLMAGLEAYSQTDEGALYRFNWVFPTEKISTNSSIGFGGDASFDPLSLESFAHLKEEQINAKIRSELNDHPLFLFRAKERLGLIESVLKDKDFVLSDYLKKGDLSHTGRQIFDALFADYEGNLISLLKHVQIERFYISRRYRSGAVSVEPQMRVDAGIRQLTVDRSLSALPPSLQNQTLFEPFGDLVDANRGVIAYEDFLKRHPDLNKYLLSTAEKATVSLDSRILYLDTIYLASANEDYLDAFKQTPDYTSFKGRVEFVRFPYLLSYVEETKIYDEQVAHFPDHLHVAPHTTFVVALWSVLTRLHKPKGDFYEKDIKSAVVSLTPLEKADLYAKGVAPNRMSAEEARMLLELKNTMQNENASLSAYEGRLGASPREMKVLLLSASQLKTYLSPIAIFEELKKLINEPTVYPFLQMKSEGKYHRPDAFIDVVSERYLDLIDAELLSAMGLIDEAEYGRLFEKYINHVSHQKKGEKIYDPLSQKSEAPNESLMKEIEESFGKEIKDASAFRNGLISTIAAWSIDHRNSKIDYEKIFPLLFKSMYAHFYEDRKNTVQKRLSHIISIKTKSTERLEASEKENALATLEELILKHHYTEESALEIVAYLFSKRYRDS